MTLTTKQQAFVEHYLRTWNASEAARLAGYSEKSARLIGHENLTKPDIQTAIQERLAELRMSADEVLVRLAEQARATLADFIDIPAPGARAHSDATEAHAALAGWSLNLHKAEQRGKLHLIKKLKSGQWGPEIELYDAQAALQLLGRHHKLFVDRTELTGKDGNPIEVSDARAALAAKLARRAGADDPEAGSGGS